METYPNQEWAIHVFSWVVGIRGLMHPPHTHALLKFLEVPQLYWMVTLEHTVLASVKALYFLHTRICFVGLPEGGLLECCVCQHKSGEEDSDMSDINEPMPIGGRGTRELQCSGELGMDLYY